MDLNAPTYKDALTRYRASAAAAYERPDKARSTRKGAAWLLNTADNRLLAIVRDDGHVLHGAALNAFYRQMSAGLPGPGA